MNPFSISASSLQLQLCSFFILAPIFCDFLFMLIESKMATAIPTIATAATAHSDTLMQNVDGFLRTIGYDLPTLVSALNIKSIGIIIAIAIVAIFIIDLFGFFGSGGDTLGSSYSSYGRSLLTTAANVWEQRKLIGFEPYLRNGRSLDSMESVDAVISVLDSLTMAVHKWDRESEKSHNEVRSRVLFSRK